MTVAANIAMIVVVVQVWNDDFVWTHYLRETSINRIPIACSFSLSLAKCYDYEHRTGIVIVCFTAHSLYLG